MPRDGDEFRHLNKRGTQVHGGVAHTTKNILMWTRCYSRLYVRVSCTIIERASARRLDSKIMMTQLTADLTRDINRNTKKGRLFLAGMDYSHLEGFLQ